MYFKSRFSTSSQQKSHKTCFSQGILFGNVSHHLGKKRELDGHTHDWRVYVKPVDNEDMSPYVKKVQFRLHESYANQNRIVSKPPYEVSESGWGEFEIQIRIHFNDVNEKPVTFYHVLKLFHNSSGSSVGGGGSGEGGGGSGGTSNVPHGGTTTAIIQGRKSVISECYDEIIFQVINSGYFFQVFSIDFSFCFLSLRLK